MKARNRSRLKRAIQPYVDVLGVTSAAYTNLKSQLNDMAPLLIDFTRDPLSQADERLREFVGLIRPVETDGLRLVRVGTAGDGGYVMAAAPPVAWALSIGVGTDVSWDLALARQGTRVVMFDPTIRRLPDQVPGGEFFRVGLGASDVGSLRRFESLMHLARFPGDGAGFLKIDVEGAEWESLRSIEATALEPFSQIAMELHGIGRLVDPAEASKMLAVLTQLGERHVPIHVHANNYSQLVRFGAYWFPDAIEVTFLRADPAAACVPATRIGSDLDVGCDPRTSDIDLSGILTVAPAESR